MWRFPYLSATRTEAVSPLTGWGFDLGSYLFATGREGWGYPREEIRRQTGRSPGRRKRPNRAHGKKESPLEEGNRGMTLNLDSDGRIRRRTDQGTKLGEELEPLDGLQGRGGRDLESFCRGAEGAQNATTRRTR